MSVYSLFIRIFLFYRRPLQPIFTSQKCEVKWKSPFEKQLLTNLSPFLISGLFIMLTPQLGPLVLEKTLPLTLVGLFAVAYRIPSALYQIPGLSSGAFFPFAYLSIQPRWVGGTYRLNISQMKIMSYIGVCMTLSLFYLAEYLVTILFGDEWSAACLPLKNIVLYYSLTRI